MLFVYCVECVHCIGEVLVQLRIYKRHNIFSTANRCGTDKPPLVHARSDTSEGIIVDISGEGSTGCPMTLIDIERTVCGDRVIVGF